MPLRVLHFFNVFTVEKRICRVSQCVIVGFFIGFYRVLHGFTRFVTRVSHGFLKILMRF